MTSPRNGLRAVAKKAQWWLREDRRMERGLHGMTKLEGPATRFSHELIVPMTSTYSPWYDDQQFRSAYDAIDGNTFVDQYKCWELWEQLGQLGTSPATSSRSACGAGEPARSWQGGPGLRGRGLPGRHVRRGRQGR